jgi:NAD(P)-dependent dehydrogenase (short-subunit alcohol dehydrogenase family)
MSSELAGRTAMVVGAEFAAGAAIALALAEAGADVAVCALHPDESVLRSRKVKRAIEGMGRRSAEYVMDVMLGRNVQVTTRQVAKEMGGLDIVVSAAELPFEGPLDRITETDLARVVALNFSSHVFITRTAAGELARNEAGGSVLIATRRIDERAAGRAVFHAAQAGARQLVHEAARELGERGIRVNGLAVGEASNEAIGDAALRLVSGDDNGQVIAVG